jgi:hypothetical protein
MSHLGHQRTSPALGMMSALPPIPVVKSGKPDVVTGMSAFVPIVTSITRKADVIDCTG